ncbi:MAG: LytTR family transcriptional regulator [Alphaproteobacteria bacterium]|nr:LytTR family transcriptional regulator [Alphaproteobacteria bacterium]
MSAPDFGPIWLRPHWVYAAGMGGLWAIFVSAMAGLYVALRLATGYGASPGEIALFLAADACIALVVGCWLFGRAERWAHERRPIAAVAKTIAQWGIAAVAAISVLILTVALARTEAAWEHTVLTHVISRWPTALVDLGFFFAIALSVVPVPYLRAAHDRGDAPKRTEGSQDARILIRNGKGDAFVPIETVVAVTAAENYVELHCGERSYLHRATLAQMEALLGPPDFMRVHRGVIVRLSAVAAVERPRPNQVTLTLRDGRTFGVGRSYRSDVLSALKETVRPAI